MLKKVEIPEELDREGVKKIVAELCEQFHLPISIPYSYEIKEGSRNSSLLVKKSVIPVIRIIVNCNSEDIYEVVNRSNTEKFLLGKGDIILIREENSIETLVKVSSQIVKEFEKKKLIRKLNYHRKTIIIDFDQN